MVGARKIQDRGHQVAVANSGVFGPEGACRHPSHPPGGPEKFRTLATKRLAQFLGFSGLRGLPYTSPAALGGQKKFRTATTKWLAQFLGFSGLRGTLPTARGMSCGPVLGEKMSSSQQQELLGQQPPTRKHNISQKNVGHLQK